jgi:hypothetical protein
MALTQPGKFTKWGAIENRKQKQTANTQARLVASCCIECIGRFRPSVVCGLVLIKSELPVCLGLPENAQLLQAVMLVRVTEVLLQHESR